MRRPEWSSQFLQLCEATPEVVIPGSFDWLRPSGEMALGPVVAAAGDPEPDEKVRRDVLEEGVLGTRERLREVASALRQVTQGTQLAQVGCVLVVDRLPGGELALTPTGEVEDRNQAAGVAASVGAELDREPTSGSLDPNRLTEITRPSQGQATRIAAGVARGRTHRESGLAAADALKVAGDARLWLDVPVVVCVDLDVEPNVGLATSRGTGRGGGRFIANRDITEATPRDRDAETRRRLQRSANAWVTEVARAGKGVSMHGGHD